MLGHSAVKTPPKFWDQNKEPPSPPQLGKNYVEPSP